MTDQDASRSRSRIRPVTLRTVARGLLSAVVLAAAVAAQGAFTPARFRSGALPDLPPLALGGGQVFVEASVSNAGRVTGVAPLRTTPPFTNLVVAAVRGWQFAPAEIEVESDA